MYLILIALIAVIFIIYKFHSHLTFLRAFLTQYTDNTKLFDTLASMNWREYLLVESSIKINLKNGRVNAERYTVPILYRDLTYQTLTEILTAMGLSEHINEVDSFIRQYTAGPLSDIIFGTDTEQEIQKVYVDNGGRGELYCLEIDSKGELNQKHYQRANKRMALKYSSLLANTPGNYKNWNFVLSKQDNKLSDEVVGYHIYLKTPVTVSKIAAGRWKIPAKYLTHSVYWVSISQDDLTLYTRPNTWYLEMLKFLYFFQLFQKNKEKVKEKFK